MRKNVSILALAIGVSSAGYAAETTTYTYDALGRLTASSRSGGANSGVNASTTYDSAGNRTNYTVNGIVPPPTISIADASATEGGVLTFSVTLSAAASKSVTVNYSTANGSAAAGSDYTATSGTLTFAPGETSKSVTVASIDDSTYEGNETFTVSLSSPSNASLGRSAATGTIVENDAAPVTFAVSGAATVVEGGVLVFTVTKGNSTTGTTSVNYATANGTATAGSDYNATSGTLTFGPSETAKTVSVQTIDDAVQESTETVLLNLSNAVGGSISVSQASGSITDNDFPNIVALNPSLSYSSAAVYTITISTLVNLNGGTGTITGFTVPSGKGSAAIASGGQSLTYTAATVNKATLCEPVGNTISFAVPYAIQNSANGAVTNGSAVVYVTGPPGDQPTGNKQCP